MHNATKVENTTALRCNTTEDTINKVTNKVTMHISDNTHTQNKHNKSTPYITQINHTVNTMEISHKELDENKIHYVFLKKYKMKYTIVTIQ